MVVSRDGFAAENGSKSLKGGRTVREGALTSGTAAADLEREEEASSADLSANARPKRRRYLARHRLFRKCALGVLYPVAGVRSRNAPAQQERNRICARINMWGQAPRGGEKS